MRGKTGGFHCAECSAHFFYEEYFLEHIRELHLPSKRVNPAAVAADNNNENTLTQSVSDKNVSTSHDTHSDTDKEVLLQSTQCGHNQLTEAQSCSSGSSLSDLY